MYWHARRAGTSCKLHAPAATLPTATDAVTNSRGPAVIPRPSYCPALT